MEKRDLNPTDASLLSTRLPKESIGATAVARAHAKYDSSLRPAWHVKVTGFHAGDGYYASGRFIGDEGIFLKKETLFKGWLSGNFIYPEASILPGTQSFLFIGVKLEIIKVLNLDQMLFWNNIFNERT